MNSIKGFANNFHYELSEAKKAVALANQATK